MLKTHNNIESNSVKRTKDILFETTRLRQNDKVLVLCLREYTFGTTLYYKVLEEFPNVNIIYIGGGWSGYTKEAKSIALENKTGIYVTNEMTGALFKDEYWAYHKRNQEGDPDYFYHSENH